MSVPKHCNEGVTVHLVYWDLFKTCVGCISMYQHSTDRFYINKIALHSINMVLHTCVIIHNIVYQNKKMHPAIT